MSNSNNRDIRLLPSKQGAFFLSLDGTALHSAYDPIREAAKTAAALDWKTAIPKPVILIASTRDGEERDFAAALAKRRDLLRRALVLLVPRHPQRFDEVDGILREAGLHVCRRSTISAPEAISDDVDVLLGDSMGEMSFYCALGAMTVMGGSFGDYGSQNVIEPAMAGTPVVVGPSIFNFEKIIRDGLKAGAMVQSASADEALEQCSRWIDEPAELEAAARNATVFAEEWSGATARMMKVLEDLWQTARKRESRMS